MQNSYGKGMVSRREMKQGSVVSKLIKEKIPAEQRYDNIRWQIGTIKAQLSTRVTWRSEAAKSPHSSTASMVG